MNLLAVLSIFFLIEEVISSNNLNAPLALIKNHNLSDSTNLELVIPQKPNSEDIYDGDYVYEVTVNEKDKFLIACPARSNVYEQWTLESALKESNRLPEESELFILNEYNETMSSAQECFAGKPSIEKVNVAETNENGNINYCGQSNAEIYNVGFPVSNDDGTDFQFVSMYKICHSSDKGKGTLYTVHHIVSPSLLLKEVWDYYKPKNEELYKCFLDSSDSNKKLLNKKEYPFQFVGIDDMPTKIWGTTTQFSFNYTPITQNEDVLRGMITVDNYIRLYSHATNKPLPLYSGTHRKVVDKPLISCMPGFCTTPTPVDLFWRIIINDEDHAVIIVTQHTLIKCDVDFSICPRSFVLVKEYKNGGCTYMCLADDQEVIERLGLPSNKVIDSLKLPSLKIQGNLGLTFPRRSKLDGNLSKNVSIFDFFGEDGFEIALKKADSKLASEVKVYSRSAESDEYSRSGGNDRGGDGRSGIGILAIFGVGIAADSAGGGGGGGGEVGGGGAGFD